MKGKSLFCALLIFANMGASKYAIADTVVHHERIFHSPAYESRRQNMAREEREKKKAQELERQRAEETARAEAEKKKTRELERQRAEDIAQTDAEKKKAQDLERQKTENTVHKEVRTRENEVSDVNKGRKKYNTYKAENVFIGKSTYTCNEKNENDAYEAALLDAKRVAVEQAGTHIQVSSEINNFQLTVDKVKVLSSAIVKLLPDSVEKKIISTSFLLSTKTFFFLRIQKLTLLSI